jgi:hypothetical protein
MRHLMTEHAEVLGAAGRGIVSRIDGALDFAEKLLATNPMFSRANPLVGDRLKKMKEHNRHYLAHEYFNRDWHPMHFSTMAQWLEPAKVQFACSAHLLDAIDAVNLTPEQQTFLAEIPDAMFRQSVRDFMVNQQFRKDYWVKGVRQLSPLEQTETLRRQRLLLVSHRPDVSLKVSGALGEAALSEAVYAPLLDLMADHAPRTLGEMEQALAGRTLNWAQLLQATMVLAGSGHLAPVQHDEVAQRASTTARAANDWLLQRARGSSDLSYLASAVTGGAVAVGRFQQLFLLARQQGHLALDFSLDRRQQPSGRDLAGPQIRGQVREGRRAPGQARRGGVLEGGDGQTKDVQRLGLWRLRQERGQTRHATHWQAMENPTGGCALSFVSRD